MTRDVQRLDISLILTLKFTSRTAKADDDLRDRIRTVSKMIDERLEQGPRCVYMNSSCQFLFEDFNDNDIHSVSKFDSIVESPLSQCLLFHFSR